MNQVAFIFWIKYFEESKYTNDITGNISALLSMNSKTCNNQCTYATTIRIEKNVQTMKNYQPEKKLVAFHFEGGN